MATGQVRTESELLELFKDNVTQDIYPVDIRDFVVTMFFEIASVTGVSSYVYIAYADDAAGTGFTLAFDPSKDYIAIRSTTFEIPSPVVGDFTGLWTKYRGDKGDPGTSILTGIVDPLSGDGNDGDVFLNTTSYELFGPKSGGIWGTGTSLIGNGVAGVALINTVGNVDTYRMSFTDGTFFDYDVTNGAGDIQNGIQLGTGADVFKQLDANDDMEFRSIRTATTSNINVVEDANNILINFQYDLTTESLLPIPDWGGVGHRIYVMYAGRFFKYAGGFRYTGPGASYSPGDVFANISHGVSADAYVTIGHYDSSLKYIQPIGCLIRTDGRFYFQTSFSVSSGDFLYVDDVTYFRN
jgi:hypothetical protein